MGVLLSSAYLPPIEYCAFLTQDEIWIERCENFQKQSFRNRTVVLTANGTQTLSVPVIHNRFKEPVEQTRIEYVTPWQRSHWRTIESAYGGSPFFLYYQDAFRPFYEKRYEYLFDFNLQITQMILEILNIPSKIKLTLDYKALSDNDLRTIIHPRRKSEAGYPFLYPEPYYQVFSCKYGFISNLSILDLIFNMGPESTSYLQNAYNYFKTSEIE